MSLRTLLARCTTGLLLAGVLGVPPAAASVAPTSAARTWVVDAVDDAYGNRWVSADTGTSTVTVAPGDTVEWQFDVGTAAIEHDLTSEDTGAAWSPAVSEYRVPGGEPVRHTFLEPGVYHYLCSIHGTVMRGTVVVAEPGDNRPPTADPMVAPTSGPAPLTVHTMAHAADPDGDELTYLWDFGAADDSSDQRTTELASWTFTEVGAYSVRLEVSDGQGGVTVRDLPVTVTGGPSPLPVVTALASPDGGGAPLDVAFSAEVTTAGAVRPFAAGTSTYPDAMGAASLVRRRGDTAARLEVTGLKPSASHMVHVHEQPCDSSDGGAHFRFDETQPFAEANEIWLPFTTDATGESGVVTVTQPQRAGTKAVSVVVHDPDNPALRIACADLAPSTVGLSYTWDFGDGSSAAGADVDHTYAVPGRYEATLTVHDADHRTTTSTVGVRVRDTTGPVLRRPTPTGRVADRTPRVAATVFDRLSRVRARDVRLRVDGRIRDAAYSPRRERVTWTPARRLPRGRHAVRLVARDASGNRSVLTWTFRIRP